MKKANEFDYVNKAYGLALVRGMRVRDTRKNIVGTVSKGDGAYIHILWDGALKTKGPYHPTSDLEYFSI